MAKEIYVPSGGSKSLKSVVYLTLATHFSPDQLCLKPMAATPSWLEGISVKPTERNEQNQAMFPLCKLYPLIECLSVHSHC